MKAYLVSFWISVESTGFAISNRIVASDHLPTSRELRALEQDVMAVHPDRPTSVVAISVSALGD